VEGDQQAAGIPTGAARGPVEESRLVERGTCAVGQRRHPDQRQFTGGGGGGL
jgi:hypothetical protein